MAIIEIPQIVIFDNYETDRYRGPIKDAVDHTGYCPRIYKYAQGALVNLSESKRITTALIARVDSSVPRYQEQALRSLFITAFRLEIPTAMIAEDIDEPVIPQNVYDRDIILPASQGELIASRIATWLKSLRPDEPQVLQATTMLQPYEMAA